MAGNRTRRQRIVCDSEPSARLGVSRRALTIARLLDRHCRTPGIYAIKLVIPSHGRAHWEVELSRLERIRSMDLGWKKPGS